MIDQYVTDHFPTAIAPKEARPTMPAEAYVGLLRGIVRTSTHMPNLTSSPRPTVESIYFQIEGQSALHGARRRGLRSLMSQLAKLRVSLSPHSLHRLPAVKVNHRTEWKHLMT
jgi:hypothetical protein